MEATPITRKFQVDPGIEREVREILGTYVRLTFTEKRRLALTLFVVTGPQDVIDAAAKEIDAADDKWWQLIQI